MLFLAKKKNRSSNDISLTLLVWILFLCLSIVDTVVPKRSRRTTTSSGELNQTMLWPHGAYGLPKANGGCPEGSWSEGWCVISTLKNALRLPEGQHAAHMYGWVTNEDKDIAMHFCMKGVENTGSSSGDTPLWPGGTYCILQSGESCPRGFITSVNTLKWGEISVRGGHTPNVHRYNSFSNYMIGYYKYDRWDYKHSYYYNAKGINHFQRFDLCCRSDGNITKPVDLPNQHSFILLANLEQLRSSGRASRPCQEVKGMQVEPEVIGSNFTYDVTFSNHPNYTRTAQGTFVLCYYSPLGPGVVEDLDLTTLNPLDIMAPLENGEISDLIIPVDSISATSPVTEQLRGTSMVIQHTEDFTICTQQTVEPTIVIVTSIEQFSTATVSVTATSTQQFSLSTASEQDLMQSTLPMLTSSSTPSVSNSNSMNSKSDDLAHSVGWAVVGILIVIVLLVIIVLLSIMLIYNSRRRFKRNFVQESPRILEFSSHVPLLRESDVDNNGESVSLHASENHLYSEVNYSEPRNITVEGGDGDVRPVAYAQTRATTTEQTRDISVHYEIASLLDVPPSLHPLGCGCSMHIYSTLTLSHASSDDEEMFVEPPRNAKSIYSSLRTGKYVIIPESAISIDELIGCGNFGDVYKGTWRKNDQEVTNVAVKKLRKSEGEELSMKFLQEAAIMGQFNHPNIVRLHGVVDNEEGDEPELSIVIELLLNGNLRDYLCAVKSMLPLPEENDLSGMLLRFAREIAHGMSYLSRKKFVHRDLAARNILLDGNYVCKISDFGMTRDIEDSEYYVSRGGQIPLKWTAPEALAYKKYSTASDVWSYGCVLYEIWSLGEKPLNDFSVQQVCSKILAGYRQHPPPGCPRALYQLMIDCWSPQSAHRPSFESVCHVLRQPQSSLLLWTQTDLSVHKDAATLGADPCIGELLYADLQKVYL